MDLFMGGKGDGSRGRHLGHSANIIMVARCRANNFQA